MLDLTSFKNWMLLEALENASCATHCSNVEDFFRKYSEFTQENVTAYFSEKINVWNPSSFNLYLNSLKWYAKFLKVNIEFPKQRKINRNKIQPFLTEKDFLEIYQKLPVIFNNGDKVQTIFKLLFELGLRPKEILQLKRQDFDLKDKILSITKTKTHVNRILPLSNDLCSKIEIIFNQEAEKINAFNIKNNFLNYMCKRISEMFNIKIHPYSLRHSFAHNLLSKKMQIPSLQVLMGHATPLTTLGYLKVSEKEAVDEARKILNKKQNKRKKK